MKSKPVFISAATLSILAQQTCLAKADELQQSKKVEVEALGEAAANTFKDNSTEVSMTQKGGTTKVQFNSPVRIEKQFDNPRVDGMALEKTVSFDLSRDESGDIHLTNIKGFKIHSVEKRLWASLYEFVVKPQELEGKYEAIITAGKAGIKKIVNANIPAKAYAPIAALVQQAAILFSQPASAAVSGSGKTNSSGAAPTAEVANPASTSVDISDNAKPNLDSTDSPTSSTKTVPQSHPAAANSDMSPEPTDNAASLGIDKPDLRSSPATSPTPESANAAPPMSSGSTVQPATSLNEQQQTNQAGGKTGEGHSLPTDGKSSTSQAERQDSDKKKEHSSTKAKRDKDDDDDDDDDHEDKENDH